VTMCVRRELAEDDLGQGRHQRARRRLTDPAAPTFLLATCLVIAQVVSSDVLAWATFAGLAGYSLSGSV
jgi:hypothetical protein